MIAELGQRVRFADGSGEVIARGKVGVTVVDGVGAVHLVRHDDYELEGSMPNETEVAEAWNRELEMYRGLVRARLGRLADERDVNQCATGILLVASLPPDAHATACAMINVAAERRGLKSRVTSDPVRPYGPTLRDRLQLALFPIGFVLAFGSGVLCALAVR